MSPTQQNLSLTPSESRPPGSKRKVEVCPTCGAKTVEYRHTLNRGMAMALLKLYRIGGKAFKVRLNLTNSQYGNWQKLRYWNFIRKLGPSGMWQITDAGTRFIKGTYAYKNAWTYRGIPKRWGGDMVSITDVWPEYEKREDYAATAVAARPNPVS